jgi:hypothetical protein
MCRKPIRLGILALALSASAGAVPQTAAPWPATTSVPTRAASQNNGPAQPNASSQTKGAPTPEQLEQPGAVVMAPPILRNVGTTYLGQDQPLLGQINPQSQRLPATLGEQAPPVMQPAPNEAAIRDNSGVVIQ